MSGEKQSKSNGAQAQRNFSGSCHGSKRAAERDKQKAAFAQAGDLMQRPAAGVSFAGAVRVTLR